jgi:hypothetical protein
VYPRSRIKGDLRSKTDVESRLEYKNVLGISETDLGYFLEVFNCKITFLRTVQQEYTVCSILSEISLRVSQFRVIPEQRLYSFGDLIRSDILEGLWLVIHLRGLSQFVTKK